MTPRKKPSLEKPLTDVELELMQVIWGREECTVKEVQTALPEGRDLAYTTVATVMKILEQKGVLSSHKGEKAHGYRPLISREEYEALSLRHLTDHVFQGDPSSMVVRLLSESKLTSDELRVIRNILDERLGK